MRTGLFSCGNLAPFDLCPFSPFSSLFKWRVISCSQLRGEFHWCEKYVFQLNRQGFSLNIEITLLFIL